VIEEERDGEMNKVKMDCKRQEDGGIGRPRVEGSMMICHVTFPLKLVDVSCAFCCLVICIKEELNYKSMQSCRNNMGLPTEDEKIRHQICL
jgi:hypothetical protein